MKQSTLPSKGEFILDKKVNGLTTSLVFHLKYIHITLHLHNILFFPGIFILGLYLQPNVASLICDFDGETWQSWPKIVDFFSQSFKTCVFSGLLCPSLQEFESHDNNPNNRCHGYKHQRGRVIQSGFNPTATHPQAATSAPSPGVSQWYGDVLKVQIYASKTG